MATQKKDASRITLYLVGATTYNIVNGAEDGGMLRVKRGQGASFDASKAAELLKKKGAVTTNGHITPAPMFTKEAAVASEYLGYDVTKKVKVGDEVEEFQQTVDAVEVNTDVAPQGGVKIG